MGIQHYSPVRGGWVCVGLSYLFTVKEGMPIVLRREGVTQLPTFDADWAHANMARAPTDYHRDIALVRREFKGDAILHNNNRLPSISVDPGLVRTTPSSSSQSEVEVSGSPAVTPTKPIVSFRNRTAKYSIHKNHKASFPAAAASPSSSESSIEISGSPILTPTKSVIPHKRIAKHSLSNSRYVKRGQYIPPLDCSPSPSWLNVSRPPSQMVSKSPPLPFPSVSPYGLSSMKLLHSRSSVSSRSSSPSTKLLHSRSSVLS